MCGRRALHVGVAGATGMVGGEFLELLAKRAFPMASLRLFASERSAGREIPVRLRPDGPATPVVVENLAKADPGGLDLIFFSAGGATAREHAPRFAAAGAVVVDNSSAFREDPDVPLVVPEINPGALASPGRDAGNIIANPNCSTIIMLLPLASLHRTFGIGEVIVSTYQAVSGAGRAALDDLVGQARSFARGEPEECRFYDEPIFMNLLPFIGEPAADGDCTEERKMRIETRRILADDSIGIYATTVRVPVERCHSESVFVRLRRETTAEEVRALLADTPGVVLADRPTPRALARREEVFVGRVRVDDADRRLVRFWVVSDQLWKGAALNAIQIGEVLLEQGRWA